jgi:hypothetical protein
MLALRQIWFRQGEEKYEVFWQNDDDFQLVVRSEQDIKLEGTRAIPFIENFQSQIRQTWVYRVGLFRTKLSWRSNVASGMAMQNLLLVEQE